MDELLKNQVRHIFDSANFVRDLGMQLIRIEDEFCETFWSQPSVTASNTASFTQA